MSIDTVVRSPMMAPAAIMTGLWSSTMVQSDGLYATGVASRDIPRAGSRSKRFVLPGRIPSRPSGGQSRSPTPARFSRPSNGHVSAPSFANRPFALRSISSGNSIPIPSV